MARRRFLLTAVIALPSAAVVWASFWIVHEGPFQHDRAGAVAHETASDIVGIFSGNLKWLALFAGLPAALVLLGNWRTRRNVRATHGNAPAAPSTPAPRDGLVIVAAVVLLSVGIGVAYASDVTASVDCLKVTRAHYQWATLLHTLLEFAAYLWVLSAIAACALASHRPTGSDVASWIAGSIVLLAFAALAEGLFVQGWLGPVGTC